MTLVAGIDPGTSGAVAVYDTESREITYCTDIPTWFEAVNKKKRKRIDTIGVMELFEFLCLLGVELVVIEAVGGRPRQSASAAFQFGYTVGILYMACMYSGVMVHTVPPHMWKKVLNVPGKVPGKVGGKTQAEMTPAERKAANKTAEGSIIKRAAEMFPRNVDDFRTARGAYRMDRAEAAMLAKFGGDYVIRNAPTLSDIEKKLAYRNADTGA